MADLACKCDETRPTCQRCIKARRVCIEPSTVKNASFLIHVENRYAAGKAKRPRGPRSSLIRTFPHIDLQTRAWGYYLQCHLHTLADVPSLSDGLSGCVAAFQFSGKPCTMVDLALSVMALAVFARTQNHPPASVEASTRYHQLLRVARGRIAQVGSPILDVRDVDACLLTVLLMGRYEGVKYHSFDFSSNESFRSLQSWSHHDGATAILKFWYDNRKDNPATYIITQIRRGLIRSFLLRNLLLPDWMLNGAHFGEHDLDLDYDRIAVRIVNLHYAFTRLPHMSSPHSVNIDELIDDARQLDQALQNLAARFPSTWSHRQHALMDPDLYHQECCYSPTVYSYSSYGYAAAQSQYFATRMLVNSTCQRLLDYKYATQLNSFFHEQQRLECTNRLKTMADDLASTIPFLLGRLKVIDSADSPLHQVPVRFNISEESMPYLGVLAVWPLTIASSLEGIDATQQLWFRSQLAEIGKKTGIGVLECAGADPWAVL